MHPHAEIFGFDWPNIPPCSVCRQVNTASFMTTKTKKTIAVMRLTMRTLKITCFVLDTTRPPQVSTNELLQCFITIFTGLYLFGVIPAAIRLKLFLSAFTPSVHKSGYVIFSSSLGREWMRHVFSRIANGCTLGNFCFDEMVGAFAERALPPCKTFVDSGLGLLRPVHLTSDALLSAPVERKGSQHAIYWAEVSSWVPSRQKLIWHSSSSWVLD